VPDIHSLPLPGALPSVKAMTSWKQNPTTYEPEFWLLEYHAHRYLGRVGENELMARYDSIVRNMQAIISHDRNIIPIHSFLSSWYWYRKEYQTRLEFALRNYPLHRQLPVIVPRDLSAAPVRPRSPNAGDVLFRYGERQWLQELVDFGRLRMKSAREYAQIENDPARHDDELVKHSYSPGAYVTITMPNGQQSHPIGDMQHSVSGTDYFLYCLSSDWDADLMQDFKAEGCAVIKDPHEFARRLETAATSQLGDWYFHQCPVGYFDPYERRPKERIDNAMSKDFRFAYQREYRLLFAGFGKTATGFVSLEMGPLHDIVEFHSSP